MTPALIHGASFSTSVLSSQLVASARVSRPVPELPSNFAMSPAALRRRANHVRKLAHALSHPEAANALHDYAAELDARADALEAENNVLPRN
jgi:hypothetical protein